MNLTEEQKERLKEVLERHEHNMSAASDRLIPKYLSTAYTDIGFLLSLHATDSSLQLCGSARPNDGSECARAAEFLERHHLNRAALTKTARSSAFDAYNQAIDDAKAAIRAESQGGGYWAAAYINAIARRCSPHVYVNRLAATTAPQPPRHVAGSSRHPHFTAEDHQRMKETLDALSDHPTEEEAEAVLQACGTSGKEVVNDFIERLLRENLELKEKLPTAAPQSECPVCLGKHHGYDEDGYAESCPNGVVLDAAAPVEQVGDLISREEAAKLAEMMAAGETYGTGRQKAFNIAAAIRALPSAPAGATSSAAATRCLVSVTGKHRIDTPYCKDCGQEFPSTATDLSTQAKAAAEEVSDRWFRNDLPDRARVQSSTRAMLRILVEDVLQRTTTSEVEERS